jgi:hypothetical protein
MTELEIIDRSVEKAHIWLTELAELAAQMPLLIRGISGGELKDVAAVFPEGLRGVLAR